MPGKQTTDSEQLQAESIEPPAGIDGLGTLAGSKRKEPPGGSAHGSADGSAAAASSSSSSNASAQPQAKAARKPYMSRIGLCAKANDAAGAHAVFTEMASAGVPCTPDACSTLMHLYASAANPMVNEAALVFEAVRAAGLVPDEASWSGFIKLSCRHAQSVGGRLQDALELVDQMIESGVTPRLRTYSPILSAASLRRDRDLASSVVSRITSSGLSLGVAEHIDLLRLAATSGSADEVHSTLRRMQQDQPVLHSAHVEMLRAVFSPASSAAPREGSTAGVGGDGGGGPTCSRPWEVSVGSGSGVLDRITGGQGWRVAACTSDVDTGVCSYSGLTLRPFALSASEQSELAQLIPTLVTPKARQNEFRKFVSWLAERVASRASHVLDGANIGYYGKSKAESQRRRRSRLTARQRRQG